MEMCQLEYASALAKYQSFTQAAAASNVTQSAISQQIRKLEEELNVQLFERSTRFVRTTPLGAYFVWHAEHILAELTLAQREVQKYLPANNSRSEASPLPAADIPFPEAFERSPLAPP